MRNSRLTIQRRGTYPMGGDNRKPWKLCLIRELMEVKDTRAF